jgi:nicotinate dehydrogenase subunit B
VPVKVVWTRLDRKDLSSSGAGETLLVGLAPALGNVIFDATGARLTSLPLAPRSFKSSGAVVSGMISP